MSAATTLKAALAHNNLALDALVALPWAKARRLPLIGPKVWAEAKRQAGTRGGARTGAGRKAADGATGLVQVAVRVTAPQREKLARLGGSVWVRAQIESAN